MEITLTELVAIKVKESNMNYLYLIDAVRRALTDELRLPKYRSSENILAGHCYVASEAIYHLLGGKRKGWKPMFIRHDNEPHWFIQHKTGAIIDITHTQFNTPVKHEAAHGKGFLTKKPSKRSREVIKRVKKCFDFKAKL